MRSQAALADARQQHLLDIRGGGAMMHTMSLWRATSSEKAHTCARSASSGCNISARRAKMLHA
jgi:hypothetical protein